MKTFLQILYFIVLWVSIMTTGCLENNIPIESENNETVYSESNLKNGGSLVGTVPDATEKNRSIAPMDKDLSPSTLLPPVFFPTNVKSTWANNPIAVGGVISSTEWNGAGKMKIPGCPIKFSESPVEVVPAAPLGEHNHEVYASLLGINDDEFEKLKQGKVI